jgi:hypothetical protein
MPRKYDPETVFKSQWKKCVQATCTPEFLARFDAECDTHLRTHRIEHEWEALYEFIEAHVFPKWIDSLIGR